MAGDPMSQEHMGNKEFGKFGSIYHVGGLNENHFLGEAIDHNEDCSEV